MPNLTDIVERLGVYDINAYLRSHDEFMDKFSHGDDPFVPVQSQPEVQQPYIRYNTRTNVTSQWWIRSEQVAYAIYDSDISNSDGILLVMVELMHRQDESARDLNSWLKETGRDDFKFNYIEYTGGSNIEPAREEGGSLPRLATFRYEYSVRRGLGIK